MRQLHIVLITLACLTRLPGAQGDDDDEDDCEFITSVSAKSEAKNLDFSMKDNHYPRDYCAYWRILASKYDVIEIDVPAINQIETGTCKNAYLKIADKKTEVIAKVKSQFLMRGPDVSIFFRPNRCLHNFKLIYRTSVDHTWTDDDFEDNRDDNDAFEKDNDNDNNSRSIGRIVGTVVGCLLAVLLLVLICILLVHCIRKRKAGRAAPGDDVSVHFWSKPSGYTQAIAATPSTSTDVPHEYDSLSVPAAHKLGPAEAGVYPHNVASHYSAVTVPVPPPYSGHSPSSRAESSPFSIEAPPSYSDAVQGK